MGNSYHVTSRLEKGRVRSLRDVGLWIHTKKTRTGRIELLERFWIRNFGCRASQADGAAIEAGLTGKGLTSATTAADADLVVLNTCTVTATADDEVRQTVRRIHREHPQA